MKKNEKVLASFQKRAERDFNFETEKVSFPRHSKKLGTKCLHNLRRMESWKSETEIRFAQSSSQSLCSKMAEQISGNENRGESQTPGICGRETPPRRFTGQYFRQNQEARKRPS